ncbi:prepilin-type N-terminal cleavage/methylation domain-containing protein [Natronobacillus azotifigens]|uniref:Type II secretion system protein n=1 Tax=Natronobacillus azotifigens TaxID=472978 RepID=A0A9J6RAR7_9BACI|nr:type II secretion system protein [Natronobacillus azotifigens]MCZ0702411.1 type II secretion system protein [Natronobacillus azotifigens]
MIKSNKGFTLIETLISMTILSIIILSLMGFFYQSTSIEHNNHNQLVAINLAQSTLIRLQTEGYNNINTIGSYTLTPCEDESTNCTPIINGDRYTTEIDIKASDADVSLYVATILITRENSNNTLATLEGYIKP